MTEQRADVPLDPADPADAAHPADPADPADAGPWEPDDWPALLRRRRRTLLAVQLGTLAVFLAFFAVLSARAHALPGPAFWALLVVVAVVTVPPVWPLRSTEGRERWAQQQHRVVRLDHALEAHVSIGEEERAAVTQRAENRRSLAVVSWIGYPLLFLLIAFLLYDHPAIPTLWQVLGTVLAAALCALGIRQAQVRAAAARRWLADPLPRPTRRAGSARRPGEVRGGR